MYFPNQFPLLQLLITGWVGLLQIAMNRTSIPGLYALEKLYWGAWGKSLAKSNSLSLECIVLALKWLISTRMLSEAVITLIHLGKYSAIIRIPDFC